jgi:hypothetical protein
MEPISALPGVPEAIWLHPSEDQGCSSHTEFATCLIFVRWYHRFVTMSEHGRLPNDMSPHRGRTVHVSEGEGWKVPARGLLVRAALLARDA